MALDFCRGGVDAQVLAGQVEVGTVVEGDLQHPRLAVQIELGGYGHVRLR